LDPSIDTVAAPSEATADRRAGRERRRVTARTFIQGSLTPRRRGGRRAGELQWLVDWDDPDLLFLALTILLLNVTDAFLTLTLMTSGASEANPLLAFVLDQHPQLFGAVKMSFTCVGVLVLVALARARVFGVFRVGMLMQALLAGYVVLIGYEWWLLRTLL
jgi:hypothetical protein